jgi:hypothetical protein
MKDSLYNLLHLTSERNREFNEKRFWVGTQVEMSLHDLGFLGRRDSSRVLAKVLDIYGLEFFKIPSHYHNFWKCQDIITIS